ncbi:ABC transporter permease [Lentibacillus saliphilus]|uniref:ABC transporter permease n=1 Tax=Lentibacillus saliphilus TaxID=2737028 RepID=UPI001C2FF149|nr:ABC transporter permease [Lentibacillus saliphilus]
MRSLFSNTNMLIKLNIRRDRIRIPVWVISLTVMIFMVAVAFEELYPTQQERDILGQTMDNPAITAMLGPMSQGPYTIGVMTAHEMLLITALIAGVMSILLFNRHNRQDEEDGRLEMIRSFPVGRLSSLSASFIVVTLTNVLLALVIGVGLASLGIKSMSLEGSLLYGGTIGATGIFFAGITALFSQLLQGSRNVFGLSMGFLLLAYLIRAAGDVDESSLSMLSPLGWVTATDAYYSNNWWPVIVLGIGGCVLFAGAAFLYSKRDLEAGLIPSRPGKQHASSLLNGPLGLVLKLQRTGMITWGVALLMLGLMYGSVLGDLETFITGNDMLNEMIVAQGDNSITEQFLPLLLAVISLIATVPPVMAMNRLYTEEKKGRNEHILSRTVSRSRQMGTYIGVALFNGFIMVSLSAIGLWTAAQVTMDDPLSFGLIFGGSMSYYMATIVMIAFSACIIGVIPRLLSLVWFYVFYSFLAIYLGGLLDIPDWLQNVSPYGHVPQIPIEDMTALPLIVLALVAVGLFIVGLTGYQKRDIAG